MGRKMLARWPLVAPLLVLVTHILPGSRAAAEEDHRRFRGISTGTTIIAVRYRDGVVVGADTRTSVSGYVSNRYANKVAFVLERDPGSGCEEEREGGSSPADEDRDTDSATSGGGAAWTYPGPDLSTCCVCRSGSSADTQRLADLCRDRLLYRSIVHRRRNTVGNAARLLRNLVLSEPDASASLICAGYDHAMRRGVIYSVAPGGSLVEEPDWAVGGSGSSYVIGFIDANYPHGEADRWSEEEAVNFVSKCVGLAMERDGSSGGMVRLYVIDKWGKKGRVRLPPSAYDEAGIGGGASSRSASPAQLKGFASPSQR